MNNTTKTISITHGNGSVQTMEVPFDFDESNIKPISQEQINTHLNALQVVDAKEYLKNTDWYIIRKSDIGTNIPDEVIAKRQECRMLISTYSAENI